MFNHLKHFGLGFILILCASHAKADIQDLNQIRDDVKSFVEDSLLDLDTEQDIEIHVGTLDSRLRLKACSTPLDFDLPLGLANRSRMTVTARCPALSWQVRIPVSVKRYAQVVFAATTIQRGELVAATDLTLARADISKLSKFYSDINALSGYAAKTTIRQGRMLNPNMVKLPKIIKRGELVRIQMNMPGLNIEASGIAMSDGVKNQTIQVKNSHSKKLIEATVIGQSLVKIHL